MMKGEFRILRVGGICAGWLNTHGGTGFDFFWLLVGGSGALTAPAFQNLVRGAAGMEETAGRAVAINTAQDH